MQTMCSWWLIFGYIFGYDPKVGFKHAHIVVAAADYDEPKMGQVVILLTNQAIEMKGLDHQLLWLVQCSMNGVLIDEVLKLLAPIHSETMYDK